MLETTKSSNQNSGNFLVTDLDEVVENGLCMGCGFCTIPIDNSDVSINMVLNKDLGHFVPQIASGSPTLVNRVCPGAVMDMVKLAHCKHGREPEDPLLGTYLKLRAAYANNDEVRLRTASGGVVSVLLKALFENGEIDVAYCAHPGDSIQDSSGRIIRSIDEINEIAGSIYHPVNFGASLKELVLSKDRFAFIGLPCEISGLEMLKKEIPTLANRHVVSVGLFCGGINTMEGINYYLSSYGINKDDIKNIEYRYGRWPGKIRLWLKNTNIEKIIPRIRGNTRWKILRYVIAFQGYWMLQRCRLCPDQIADFSDIAVGDPHSAKYRQRNDPGISAVISRTQRGEKIIRKLIESGTLCEEIITRDELIASQGYTLDNRRHVMIYQKVAKIFSLKSPRIKIYSDLKKSRSFRHYVYAFVDLMKIKLPNNKWISKFYFPWQIFEYLFITLTPILIVKRLINLFSNK